MNFLSFLDPGNNVNSDNVSKIDYKDRVSKLEERHYHLKKLSMSAWIKSVQRLDSNQNQ